MKKYIKLISFIFTTILLFSLNKSVQANIYTDAEADAGGIGSCAGYPWCWQYAIPNQKGIVNGIRVTIYDQSGNKESESVDFINDSTGVYSRLMSNSDNNDMYCTSGKFSKLDYINKNVTFSKPENGKSTCLANVKQLNFSNILTDSGNTNSNVIEDNLGISSFADFKSKFSAYESDFDFSFSNIESNPGDYYLIVEPVTVIYNTKTADLEQGFYYGTYAELQSLYNLPAKDGVPSLSGIRTLFHSKFALAKSIYITESRFGIDSNNDNVNAKDNIYGIGIFWFGKNASLTVTPTIQYGSCDDGKAYSLEYKNYVERSYTKSDTYCNCNTACGGSCSDPETSITACEIICDEKYYIETYKLKNIFNPIIEGTSDRGILAGKYFSVEAPTIYHKKSCRFVKKTNDEITEFANKVSKECSGPHRKTVGDPPSSCTYYSCKSKGANYADSIISEINSNCSALETIFKNNYLNAENNHAYNIDKVGELTLNLGFQQYTLEAKRISTENDASDDNYYYKNTFTYDITKNKDNVSLPNNYIGLSTSFNSTTTATHENRNNGSAMATSPINIKEGQYEAKLNFDKIFISSPNFAKGTNYNFLNRLSSSNVEAVKDSLQDFKCNYNIKQRDNNIINKYCDPNEGTGCGDPDTTFNIVDLKIVYRPIDLKIPFPGINYSGIGNSRTPGRNWTKSKIETYITDEGEGVYNKTQPLYVIDLDATKIKQIREYNDNNAYDNFTLKCTLGLGSECISRFLRGKLTEGNTSEQFTNNLLSGGTCTKNVQLPIPDDSGIPNENFYLCLDAGAQSWQ